LANFHTLVLFMTEISRPLNVTSPDAKLMILSLAVVGVDVVAGAGDKAEAEKQN
jgi:hypothetical protein